MQFHRLFTGIFLSHLLITGVCTMPAVSRVHEHASQAEMAMATPVDCSTCDADPLSQEDATTSCTDGQCITVLPDAVTDVPLSGGVAAIPPPIGMQTTYELLSFAPQSAHSPPRRPPVTVVRLC